MSDQEAMLKAVRSFSTRWGIVSKIAARSNNRDAKSQHSAKEKLEKRYFEVVDGMLTGMRGEARKNVVQEMFEHDWPLLLDFYQKNRSLDELCENFRKALAPPPVSTPAPAPTSPPPPPLTDDDLWSIGAAIALQRIEYAKTVDMRISLEETVLCLARSGEPRMDASAAKRLIELLRSKAGNRFSEDVDNDLPL